MNLDLPIYAKVGLRPVKLVPLPDGGMDVLAWEWETGEFTRHLEYMAKVFMEVGDVDHLTESEFEAYVKQLQAELADKRREL